MILDYAVYKHVHPFYPDITLSFTQTRGYHSPGVRLKNGETIAWSWGNGKKVIYSEIELHEELDIFEEWVERTEKE